MLVRPKLEIPMPLQSARLTVIVAGSKQVQNVIPADYKFAGTAVQSFKYLENGDEKRFGAQILAAFPIIQDHHADILSGAQWWRNWDGYFGVNVVEGNKVSFGGTPQELGRWPIDIIVLYNT